MERKFCPTCTMSFLEDEVEYCYMDGTKLVAMRTHECGRQLHPADRFCPKCGKDLTEETVTADELLSASRWHEPKRELRKTEPGPLGAGNGPKD